ncbi:MAG: DUF3306 domain-containing protein [Pseudomonadota bacterium]|nr:DUF3306 domain-containing protein [Pseudomonadota bacterium]
MNDEQNDGFLGRWSRRKARARAGQPLPEPPAPPAAQMPAPVSLAQDSRDSESNQAPVPVDEARAAINEEATSLTLDDVKALTIDSDFKPFVARGVTPEVRNAAFKKLFADPHFNVMDGLDIYIDDYTQPDPLPASMLKQMASAKFLRLVEDEPETPAGPAEECDQAVGPEAAEAEQPCADLVEGDVAQSDACKDLPMSAPRAESTGAPADAHSDLRLQPDDAARCEADRPCAA